MPKIWPKRINCTLVYDKEDSYADFTYSPGHILISVYADNEQLLDKRVASIMDHLETNGCKVATNSTWVERIS